MRAIKYLIFSYNYKLHHIWFLFFIYSTFIALFVQFILLPILLPHYHNIDGLMNGGDWVNYHYRAIDVANNIHENGWGEWSLRPLGFGIVGIISAIYEISGIYKPYILIPLFSALHALGALSIVLLIEKLNIKRYIAVISALPFLVAPSSLLWVTQILKDTFTINGSLLFLYGIVLLSSVYDKNAIKIQLNNLVLSALFIIGGIAIAWSVRTYFIDIFAVFMLIVFVVLNIRLIILFMQSRTNIINMLLSISVQFFLLISIYSFPSNASVENSDHLFSQIPNQSIPNQTIPNQNNKFIIHEWENSDWLPYKLNLEFKKLYLQRSYFYYAQRNANATIDYEYVLNNIEKLVAYSPRAIQIAYLSPFPSSWFIQHPTSMSTLMHRITGIEMLFIYIFLIGALVSLYLWRRRIELWMILGFSLYFSLIPTYAFPNIGALVRYRYAGLMLLVALGVAVILWLYDQRITESIKRLDK